MASPGQGGQVLAEDYQSLLQGCEAESLFCSIDVEDSQRSLLGASHRARKWCQDGPATIGAKLTVHEPEASSTLQTEEGLVALQVESQRVFVDAEAPTNANMETTLPAEAPSQVRELSSESAPTDHAQDILGVDAVCVPSPLATLQRGDACGGQARSISPKVDRGVLFDTLRSVKGSRRRARSEPQYRHWY